MKMFAPEDFARDEQLRLQCLREAFSDLRSAEQAPFAHTVGGWHPPQVRIDSQEVLTKARKLFWELTGREWPIWKREATAEDSAPPSPGGRE